MFESGAIKPVPARAAVVFTEEQKRQYMALPRAVSAAFMKHADIFADRALVQLKTTNGIRILSHKIFSFSHWGRLAGLWSVEGHPYLGHPDGHHAPIATELTDQFPLGRAKAIFAQSSLGGRSSVAITHCNSRHANDGKMRTSHVRLVVTLD